MGWKRVLGRVREQGGRTRGYGVMEKRERRLGVGGEGREKMEAQVAARINLMCLGQN